MIEGRVSVLLTCYNHIRFLPKAIESVLSQTYPDIEIILLDDGSKDGSREWIRDQQSRMEARCPTKIHFNESNLGTYATLNVGLDLAQGEFIAILNDDDWWLPEKIAAQVEQMRADPEIGLNHTKGEFIDANDDVLTGAPLGFFYPSSGTGDLLESLIQFNKLITSSAMFRSEVLNRCGVFDPQFFGCGDWHMWLRIAEHWHIGEVPIDGTRYRVHPENACRDDDKMHGDERVIREWMDSRRDELMQTRPDKDAIRRAMAHNAACLGTERAWFGDMKGARKAYWDSWRLLPGRFKSLARFALTVLPRKWFRRLG